MIAELTLKDEPERRKRPQKVEQIRFQDLIPEWQLEPLWSNVSVKQSHLENSTLFDRSEVSDKTATKSFKV